MVDTPSSVLIAQGGTGLPNINGLTVDDGEGNKAFQSVPRTNGSPVSTDNPHPVLDAAALLLLGQVVTLLGDPLATTVPPLNYTFSSNGTAGVGSGTLVAAGAAVRSLTIATLGTDTASVWLNVTQGGTAVPKSGFEVQGGGGSITFGTGGLPMPTAPVKAITDGTVPQVVTLNGG